jgi:AcrR family transcriptional regulator
MTGDAGGSGALPRVLDQLWAQSPPTRSSRGLSRDRIVAAAIALADADGLGALSMARLANRLGCGTMSLYRHIAGKDDLVVFMLSAAPEPPPPASGDDWRAGLSDWAGGLWQVYHRHPWVLHTASSGPPADPGQLAWLEAGLAALRSTGLAERDKVSAVVSLLHYVRGAAALAIDSGVSDDASSYPATLRKVIGPERFPAIAAAVDAGAFDADAGVDFRSGVDRVLDGIDVLVRRAVANRPGATGLLGALEDLDEPPPLGRRQRTGLHQ